ncbi:MAG: ribonuclease III [Rhizobiaceae bacterium]
MANRKDTPLTVLAERIGYVFADPERLNIALTHASARAGKPGADYERLEFLGDRVLGLVVADMLFRRHPEANQGELALRLNALVNGETLALVADEIGLADFVRTGQEISRASARRLTNLRADIVEALLAAIYLDGGMAPARAFVERFWAARAEADFRPRRDPKTALQEWAHKAHAATPHYETLSRDGPDHAPVFTVRVSVGDLSPETASGTSRRAAEQDAAARMLAANAAEDDQ